MPTVLVTGANRGIGLEFARQYRKDGWRVIGTARDPDRAKDLKSLGAEVPALDVADRAAVARLGRELERERIDVLIANAGIGGQRDIAPDNIDEQKWTEIFRVNVMAPLALAGAFHAQVARSGERKMIAISSRMGSIELTAGGRYDYRASKAALNMVWRSLSVDWTDVTAVMLHPGWVRTEMGGAGADLTPEASVAGMRRVIAGVTQADTGRFFNHDGTPLPW